MFDDHFIKMDIVNHYSFIVIVDLDGLVDHSAAPAGHFVDLFDHFVVQLGRLGCNAGLVGDYFELAAGDFVAVVDNFAALIDRAGLLAGRSDLPDDMIVLVDLLVDLSGQVDYFASLCFAIFANDFELAAVVADVFAVQVGPAVWAVDGMADLKRFHYRWSMMKQS